MPGWKVIEPIESYDRPRDAIETQTKILSFRSGGVTGFLGIISGHLEGC